MKVKDAKLFLNSVKKINDKYQQCLKNSRIGVEIAESHSAIKYYIIDKTSKENKENKENK